MPQLQLSSNDPSGLDVDVLVVGLHSGDDSPSLAPGADAVAARYTGDLLADFDVLGASGEAGSTWKLPASGLAATMLVGVGLGKPGDVSAETLRRAGGAAVRSAAGKQSIGFAVDGDLEALGLGALLGGYRFHGYKSTPSEETTPAETIVLCGGEGDVARATALAAGSNAARDWVNTPGNLLRPPDLAASVSERAAAAGLGVEVLDEKELADGGYGGILAVGSGSQAPPRLVKLTYRAEGAAKHVALVGKGITFDTGGYSLKPAQGMWDMKGDMAGAAAVAGAMLAIAALRPSVNVTAYLPLAENMVSGGSYRPGDVVTMYGGKTVEIVNTDQEGRMVLGDALARASQDGPDVLYETSTLTGGQVTALGKRHTGVMGTPEECERVKAAGERTGELMWPMPMPEEIVETTSSTIADTLQGSANMERSGHMLQGGIFLSKFVDENLPWAHLDVAGPSSHSGSPYGYIVKGPTAVPLRTLVELVEEQAR